ncbi:hypothetical protein NQ317_010830 [Molorchus minor]|uniref:Uncharacterized protein n=1 Tax=Molorchus minor TaxID=1323400 RepID=A0ABQ9JNK4_9CUCU|nr:hypothetical protein NQ317_010830 [Molorchus minor]
MFKILLQICLYLLVAKIVENRVIVQRSTDGSVKGYLTERICWWNEICKEEFQSQFKCKCPEWSFAGPQDGIITPSVR